MMLALAYILPGSTKVSMCTKFCLLLGLQFFTEGFALPKARRDRGKSGLGIDRTSAHARGDSTARLDLAVLPCRIATKRYLGARE